MIYASGMKRKRRASPPTRRANVPSRTMRSLAGKILEGYKPTRDEIESLAGSILANAPKKAAK